MLSTHETQMRSVIPASSQRGWTSPAVSVVSMAKPIRGMMGWYPGISLCLGFVVVNATWPDEESLKREISACVCEGVCKRLTRQGWPSYTPQAGGSWWINWQMERRKPAGFSWHPPSLPLPCELPWSATMVGPLKPWAKINLPYKCLC